LGLKAIVVGAGIGGLACADALRRADAQVIVLEQAPAIQEIGAGLGLAPNAVGALTALGVAERLRPAVSEPDVSTRRRWQDGTDLFVSSLAETLKEYGFRFWFAHRGDLQRALLETAQDPAGPGPAVDIRLGVRVTAVDAEHAAVHTADGERLRADVVVGADGINSTLRELLVDVASPDFTGHSGFRTQVDVATLPPDGDLATLVARNGFESWLGPHGHVVHAPFRKGSVVNVAACLEADAIEGPRTSAPVDLEETLAHLDGWHPTLRQLISAGNGVRRYDIYTRPPLTHWTYGRACLIGDACHPMFPYLGQGAAQAIEDGDALGVALTGVGSGEVPEALAWFEQLRLERANRVQALSAANAITFHLPDGPRQVERDRAVAAGAIDTDVTRWLWAHQNPAVSASNWNGASIVRETNRV
jgi:salicylate hydroxylase